MEWLSQIYKPEGIIDSNERWIRVPPDILKQMDLQDDMNGMPNPAYIMVSLRREGIGVSEKVKKYRKKKKSR